MLPTFGQQKSPRTTSVCNVIRPTSLRSTPAPGAVKRSVPPVTIWMWVKKVELAVHLLVIEDDAPALRRVAPGEAAPVLSPNGSP